MDGFKFALTVAVGASALALAACDNGPSAVRQGGGDRVATASAPDRTFSRDEGASDQPRVDHRKDTVAAADDGRPVWSPSKRFSADESAQRAFERNGEDFEAKTLDQFVKKAHAFVGHPPKGTLTLTRKNGDTLYYDPKGNIFAVANKEGAPRTMFKPDDGMAYWEKQKSQEERRSARRSRNSDDQA